jgi:proteasome lid subunit RPN8/RPN11
MGRLNVYIVDTTGNKEQQATLPDDVSVGRILEKLTSMLELPAIGPENEHISYRLIHKASGDALNDRQTLTDAGVEEDDHLRVQPEITAKTQSVDADVDPFIELGDKKNDSYSGKALSIIPSEQVQQQIQAYTATVTDSELAGILLGTPEESADGIKLMITAMIKAKRTAATSTSVTFTHDTWEQIHREKEILYPEMTIVGWFHTHLGTGNDLSQNDQFIQQHFFNLPWQVALVIDSVNAQQTYYTWHDDQLEPLQWGLLSNERLAASSVIDAASQEVSSQSPVMEAPIPDSNRQEGPQQANRQYRWLLTSLVLGILLVFTNIHRVSAPTEIELPEPPPVVNDERTNELEAAVILHEQQIQELENENRHLEALVDELSGENFLIHTVTRGETLWSISRDYYDDPLQYRILMELNQIEDPDNLEVGRRLLVINPAE